MKKLVLILAMTILPLSSYAQDAFYISGLLGMTQLDPSEGPLEYNTELSYGLRGGHLFNDHVSAGVFVHRVVADATNPGAVSEATVDNLMAEVTYFFSEADENSFFLSGLLGTTKFTNEGNGISLSESGTSFGASAGYHFMVAPNFSLSPQVTYITSDIDGIDVSEVTGMINLTLWL